MDKPNVKGIPYGVANFEEVRSKNRYYVDKTMYLLFWKRQMISCF